MVRADAVKLCIQIIEMGQIAHADGTPANLVLISRANAPPGGADLSSPAGIFAQAIQIAVERQDERRVFGNVQIGG